MYTDEKYSAMFTDSEAKHEKCEILQMELPKTIVQKVIYNVIGVEKHITLEIRWNPEDWNFFPYVTVKVDDDVYSFTGGFVERKLHVHSGNRVTDPKKFEEMIQDAKDFTTNVRVAFKDTPNDELINFQQSVDACMEHYRFTKE